MIYRVLQFLPKIRPINQPSQSRSDKSQVGQIKDHYRSRPYGRCSDERILHSFCMTVNEILDAAEFRFAKPQ